MTHGDAITFASIGVMRVKLPALINQITIIGSIVSNEISILVGRVVHARSAIPETFVDIIEVCECVLLSSRPPIIVTAIVVVIVVVVVSVLVILVVIVHRSRQSKAIIGLAQVVIWL